MSTQAGAQQHRIISQIPLATPSFEAISLPQSQTSSLNESLSSQPQDVRNAISQESSLLRTASPATSISKHSSQDKAMSPMRAGSTRKMYDVAGTGEDRKSWSSHQGFTAHGRPTSAPKRMSNGELKPAAGGSAVDRRIHRSLSRESQAADLRDRLAFAKYKLDHGYQDLNFADVEAITSQQGSPVSANSNPRSTSPHKRPILRSPPGPTAKTSVQSPQRVHFQQDLSSRSSQLPSSYDDFWTSQSQARPPILAPPADVQPRHAPPHANNVSPMLHPPAAPTTPQRRPRIGIRSPSEQRASEADAVEALAFMSSPNNSGYYPRTIDGSSKSPLRSRSQEQPGSQVAWVVQQKPQSQPRRPLTKHEQEAAIDQRLDAMSDSDDDA